jgi:hypothetical protein
VSDLFGPIPEKPKTSWPHKCATCGRFVKLSTLTSTQGGYPDYDYDATAECTKCERRVDAWPI